MSSSGLKEKARRVRQGRLCCCCKSRGSLRVSILYRVIRGELCRIRCLHEKCFLYSIAGERFVHLLGNMNNCALGHVFPRGMMMEGVIFWSFKTRREREGGREGRWTGARRNTAARSWRQRGKGGKGLAFNLALCRY